MFSMDGEANEVFYEGTDKRIFSGSYNVMDDITYYTFSDEESDEFWDFYEKNDAKLSEIGTKAIVEWFAECWNKAGSMNVKLPSYVSFHDDDECYDLHNGKWISDGDKWFD
ncbi:hypothetical protein CON72_02325 [Bacillus wiedmannii]|nr:hypothetical protein CON72_02325 [Bacillus wiedmannii]